MELKILSDPQEPTCRMAATGNITSRDFDAGGPDPLDQLLGPNWPAQNIVISLEDVPYMDSSGIGWLVASDRRSKQNQGALIFHSIHPTVSQMLQLLKMGTVLSLADDEEAAVALADA